MHRAKIRMRQGERRGTEHVLRLETASPTSRSGSPHLTVTWKPLDAASRSHLEPKFGHSFEGVRIHTDEAADEVSRSVGARAFTVGEDLFFRSGAYEPNTEEGQHLLAHELTHVVQQARFGAPDNRALSRQSDTAEVEARTVANAVSAGQPVAVAVGPSAGIARDSDEQQEEDANKTSEGLSSDVLSSLPGGIGEAFEGTKSFSEAMDDKDPVSGGLSLASALASPLGVAGELGDWSKEMPGASAFTEGLTGTLGVMSGAYDLAKDVRGGNVISSIKDAGSTLMSGGGMFTDASLLGEEGASSVLTGGGLGEGALLTTDLGSIFSTGAAAGGAAGSTAAGLGALATAGGAVLASGAAGAAIGTYLAHDTEVGQDSVDTIGGVDRLLGGDPEHGHSTVLDLDEARQKNWEEGGWGYLRATGDALGEAGIGLAGAVGGLATGAAHGVEHAASWLWDKL